jgi:tetratricopeptide (TPR) repeat protein
MNLPLALISLSLSLSIANAQPQPAIQDLIDAGHYKRARAAAEATFKETPRDAETLCLMSIVRGAFGNLDEAEKFAEKAVALNPKSARYHFQLAEVVGQKAQNAGVFHQIGLGRQFKKEAETTLQLDSHHVGALFDMMMFYLKAPGIIGGDKTKARANAEQILKIDPVRGYTALLTLAHEEKQEGRDEELLRKAVEARPDSYEARASLSAYLINQKKWDEARGHLREAIRLRPDRVSAYGLSAVVAAQQDQWADLDAVLAQAEKAVPDNLLPYYRAANNCLGRKVELPRAERYLRKYLTMEPEPNAPNNAAAHWRLGLVLSQAGRKADAVAELETAVRMDGNNAAAKADLKRIKG